MSIELLDCTLRDGGYVNDFAFGTSSSRQVIAGLTASGIEYVEIGFLRNTKNETETTVFTSVKEAEALLPEKTHHSKIFLMIVYGKFDIDKLPDKKHTKIDGIRVTFKKHEADEALQYIKIIQEKGYIVSANPTAINSYSDQELLSVIEKVNAFSPEIFAIVDTLGMLKRNDVIRLCYIINHNLNPQILLAFHSHNNLQLSFSNAQVILEERLKRDIIIDVSVMGMGRGAGNLNTELMISYLNENYDAGYDLLPILKIIDENISKIFSKTPWGYSLPYFLAASVKCHPNYAACLINKQTISIEAIRTILTRIPADKKPTYDESLINRLYLEYQENEVDDTNVLNQFKTDIGNCPVLLVAPGKTIETHKAEIDDFIRLQKPFVISLNFRPDTIAADRIFISNAKRFAEQKDFSNIIVTSNIKADLPTLNYSSYLNDSELSDNTALLCLKLLIKLGVSNVFAAGLDGFANGDNFANPQMANNAKISEFGKRNRQMREMIQRFKTQISIRFITPSLYEEMA